MKPCLLIGCLLLLAFLQAGAQQHTRDILFPDFAKDFSRLQTKDKPAGTETKEPFKQRVFQNYRPQSAPAPRSTVNKTVQRRQPLPSDLSATEAARARPKAKPVQPVIPDQGTPAPKPAKKD